MDYIIIYYLFAVSYLYTCLLGYGNFVIYRLTISKRSIFENKNYCEACEQPFNAVYSYPIIGYILCLGKCTNCDSKFGNKHLILELCVFIFTYITFALKGFSLTAVLISTTYLILVLVTYQMQLKKSLEKVQN